MATRKATELKRAAQDLARSLERLERAREARARSQRLDAMAALLAALGTHGRLPGARLQVVTGEGYSAASAGGMAVDVWMASLSWTGLRSLSG